MPTTHTTPIDLRGFHGREFEGVINGIKCKGRISIDEVGDVMLCQNVFSGASPSSIGAFDSFGYNLTCIAQFSNKDHYASGYISSITILDPPSSIDPRWDWKDGEEVACGSHLQKIFILINGSVIHIVNDKGVVVNSGTPEGVYSLGYRKLPTRKLTEITEEMFRSTAWYGKKVMYNGVEQGIYAVHYDVNSFTLIQNGEQDYSQCKLIEE